MKILKVMDYRRWTVVHPSVGSMTFSSDIDNEGTIIIYGKTSNLLERYTAQDLIDGNFDKEYQELFELCSLIQ